MRSTTPLINSTEKHKRVVRSFASALCTIAFAFSLSSCYQTLPTGTRGPTVQIVAAKPTISRPRFLKHYVIPGSNGNPGWMILGPDNNLWFSVYSGIVRMTATGQFKTYSTAPYYEVWGLGDGSDGKIWFVCYGANNTVCAISVSGQFTVLKGPYYFTGPFVLGSDGNLWSPAYDRVSEIGKISPAGVATYYAEPANGRVENITPGASGLLWFTDSIDNKVGSISATGQIHEYNIPLVNSEPGSLVLGPDGNVWLTPTAYQALVRVSPSGRGRSFKDAIQTEYMVRGNNSYVYGVATTGDIIQMNTQTGESTYTAPPTGWYDHWSVTSAVLGPDRNLWLTGEGTPTSIIQKVQIPGGTPP